MGLKLSWELQLASSTSPVGFYWVFVSPQFDGITFLLVSFYMEALPKDLALPGTLLGTSVDCPNRASQAVTAACFEDQIWGCFAIYVLFIYQPSAYQSFIIYLSSVYLSVCCLSAIYHLSTYLSGCLSLAIYFILTCCILNTVSHWRLEMLLSQVILQTVWSGDKNTSFQKFKNKGFDFELHNNASIKKNIE